MRMYDVIEKKRNGGELTGEEINFFVKGAISGEIPDYQISAFLMAVYFVGMTDSETVNLTMAMRDSGDKVDLSAFGNLSVDKHSTGGVGDKTTLIVAPIVASIGAKVAKMSGRGLGFTGGTVDKLESIEGYNTTPTHKEFLEISNKCGVSVIAQSGNMTPADKKLYALRDVTATIESIPLITSSIMSKKLAAGAKNIVLDVKCGSGAFMKSLKDAERLAENMVKIGNNCGVKTVALLTDMNTPLGYSVGNSLEVIEACEVLKGNLKGPLYDICVLLASTMVSLALNINEQEAKIRVVDSVESGRAFAQMQKWILAQGGNIACLTDYSKFKQPKFTVPVIAQNEGYISEINASLIGKTALILGAGRETAGENINFSAGVKFNKTLGEYIKLNEVICILYTDKEDCILSAKEILLSGIKITKTPPVNNPLVFKTVN